MGEEVCLLIGIWKWQLSDLSLVDSKRKDKCGTVISQIWQGQGLWDECKEYALWNIIWECLLWMKGSKRNQSVCSGIYWQPPTKLLFSANLFTFPYFHKIRAIPVDITHRNIICWMNDFPYKWMNGKLKPSQRENRNSFLRMFPFLIGAITLTHGHPFHKIKLKHVLY